MSTNLGIYLILCGAFCCIGGLVAWGWWQSKNIMRLEFLYDELRRHVAAHDEHLSVHDTRWKMNSNRMDALAGINQSGRTEEHGPLGGTIRIIHRDDFRPEG